IIMINGQNFTPQNMSVTFGAAGGGSSAQVLSGSPTSLSVVVPTPPQGFTFNTVPCGNGGTKNAPTPITITVTDNSTGCTSSFTNGFLLNPSDTTCNGQTQNTPPTASFTATAIDGHTFQFADTSTAQSGASIVSRAWDFGDGGTSGQQNPMHSYSGPFPRNVSVTLTVTDSNALSNQPVKV